MTHVAFHILPDPRPQGFGAMEPEFVVEFTPQHFDRANNRYIKEVSGWALAPDEVARLTVRIIDPARAGQNEYGRLVLYYGRRDAPELIPFDPAYVPIIERPREL